MEFVAFPVHINSLPEHKGARGWLARSDGPVKSIQNLLEIMVGTSRQGWRGAEEFGLRETLVAMASRHDARLVAIKQLNATLENLGIDWVHVENIQFEPSEVLHRLTYTLTLSYNGKGSEVHWLEI